MMRHRGILGSVDTRKTEARGRETSAQLLRIHSEKMRAVYLSMPTDLQDKCQFI